MKIFVKANPSAKEEKVEKIDEKHFKVSVKDPPVKGLANKAIIRVLGGYFKTSQIRIVSGYTNRNKIIEIN